MSRLVTGAFQRKIGAWEIHKEKNNHEIYINDLCIREDGEDIIKDNRPLSLEIKNYRLNDDKNTRGVEKY